jgi:hypothetical protein
MKTSIVVQRLALACLLSVSVASIAEAKAGHAQPGPAAFGSDGSHTLIPRQAPAAQAEPSCFIEPEGFANQIRWDGECIKARQQRTQSVATPAPSKFVAPRGFHNQIRWD